MNIRRTAEEAKKLVPDDDTLWEYRTKPWAFWREKTHLCHGTMHRYLSRRGWRSFRGKRGGWEYAPCALCGAPFKIRLTGDGHEERRCPEHVGMVAMPAVERTDYQRELEASRKRRVKRAEELQRTYTRTATPGQQVIRMNASPVTGRRRTA